MKEMTLKNYYFIRLRQNTPQFVAGSFINLLKQI